MPLVAERMRQNLSSWDCVGYTVFQQAHLWGGNGSNVYFFSPLQSDVHVIDLDVRAIRIQRKWQSCFFFCVPDITLCPNGWCKCHVPLMPICEVVSCISHIELLPNIQNFSAVLLYFTGKVPAKHLQFYLWFTNLLSIESLSLNDLQWKIGLLQLHLTEDITITVQFY